MSMWSKKADTVGASLTKELDSILSGVQIEVADHRVVERATVSARTDLEAHRKSAAALEVQIRDLQEQLRQTRVVIKIREMELQTLEKMEAAGAYRLPDPALPAPVEKTDVRELSRERAEVQETPAYIQDEIDAN